MLINLITKDILIINGGYCNCFCRLGMINVLEGKIGVDLGVMRNDNMCEQQCKLRSSLHYYCGAIRLDIEMPFYEKLFYGMQ